MIQAPQKSTSKLESHDLRTIDGVNHAFFTRKGGVSNGQYKSLNCGYGSSDLESNVDVNRALAAEALGFTSSGLLTTYQVHSSVAVVVRNAWKKTAAPRADGMVTNLPGMTLGILTADCAPVLFCDHTNRIIGIAHAGWKGALSGILEATVKSMETLGGTRHTISAAIGPCISQKNYQVGSDFRLRFLRSDDSTERFFVPSEVGKKEKFWQFDLKGFVTARLHEAAVTRIDTLDMCSYESEDEFYSYRRATHRGEEDYGRNLSAIVLNEA